MEDLGSDPISATSCVMLQKRLYLSEGNGTYSHDRVVEGMKIEASTTRSRVGT